MRLFVFKAHATCQHYICIMAKQSAGILAFRKTDDLEFFLVHLGGPFFKNKDAGVWSIPKGEFDETEGALIAAKREFYEETGFVLNGNFIELTPIKQKGGKTVYAWAIETNIDADAICSNTFEIEWPPKSGRKQQFVEVDKAGWFKANEAKAKINVAQINLIDEVIDMLAAK